jgi:hypothetical protein
MKSKLLLAAIAISACAFSQDSSFQIKDYKYRTPGFRALQLGLNFSGTYNNGNVDNVHTERQNSTYLGPVEVYYFQIKSTEKRFQESNIGFSGYFGFGSTKNNTGRSDGSSLQNGVNWSILTREFKNNQWFFEWGNEIAGQVILASSKTPSSDQRQTIARGKNTASIGFGKGRIEWVYDAQMAIFILQDLENQNLLSRKPTAQEGLLFSQLITDINNRRVFDSRRRRIYELSRIDSFLKQSGLAPQTDIRHFTTVNDNWAFANNPFRRHGSSWFVRVKPGVEVDRDRSSNELSTQASYDQATNKLFEVKPEIGYETYHAINLKWQKSFKITAAYLNQYTENGYKTVRPGNETSSKLKSSRNSWGMNANYGVGYFPNTRTVIFADLGISGSYSADNWIAGTNLNLIANYFVGYRTFLNASIGAVYLHSQTSNGNTVEKGNNFSSGFSLRLSHFLF